MKNFFIIAEIGINHNGDMKIAKKMIDEAKEAGVNAVKFQTFKAENLVSKFAEKAEYQKQTTDKNESQLDMIKKLQLSENDHLELFSYCNKKNIKFLSSPFDLESIDFLNDLEMDIFKIPSGEITNLLYLRRIGILNKKIIMSTGMANLEEVKEAINILVNEGTNRKNISLLHCTTEYPVPFDEVNLKAMLTLKEKFGLKVGYSDHTEGIEVAIAAASLGAEIIEKHFTLDKTMKGPDHRASLEPKELKEMVRSIRNVELALGDGIKAPTGVELKNIKIARKSIVAKTNIKFGEIFSDQNLTIKRPGTGISPMKWDLLIGNKAKRNFNVDEIIEI